MPSPPGRRRTFAPWWATAAALWAAFAVLTWLVVTDATAVTSADLRIDTAIHEFAVDNRWAVNLALALEAIGSVPASFMIVAAASVLLVVHAWRQRQALPAAAAGFLIVSAAGGALISTLVKHAVDRPRPPWNGVWSLEESPSYPSGHAQAGFTVWVALGLIALVLVDGRARRLVAGPLLVLGPMIGASRLVLGVHWPSDVVGGWLLGGAWLMCCTVLAAMLVPRISPRPAPAADRAAGRTPSPPIPRTPPSTDPGS